VRHVVGIDAGGTKTVGLLADEGGAVVAEARAGGANLQTHGELQVEKVFDEIFEGLGASGHGAAAAVCVGIAGVDRPRDESVIRGVLKRLGHRDRARVVNDAVIALVAGAPARHGIVVLAGTGSIVYGQDPGGRIARAGGYGYLLADEGSAYWLGHQALRSAVRSADGRGPETRLGALVLETLGAASVPDLVPRVYEQALPRFEVAKLAALVQRAADAGDLPAASLLDAAASELALGVHAAARRLAFGPDAFPVVLAGGAFKACPGLIGRLQGRVDLPGAEPVVLEREPASGAVALALELLR
jgi:N-acetylglucosamine kinase-like BadF-type ATPase